MIIVAVVNQRKEKKKSKDKTVKNKNSTEKKAPKLKMVKTTSTKRFLVHRAPQVLTIHIKRFMQTFRGIQKNEKHVRFSEFLDLTPFCYSRDFEIYVKNGLIGPAPVVNPILYRLYGVVEHLGGMGGGHYVAYVRKTSDWFHFSDSSFYRVSLDNVLSCQAYILFYERLLDS